MKKVLFLVGPHASGKTFASKEYIKNRKEYGMIDTGPIMRKIHNQKAPELSMGAWVKELEQVYGNNITSEIISNEINNIITNSICNNFIIIGFRTLKGIAYAIEQLGIENYSILYVDATQELLYSNYLAREHKIISFNEFKEYLNDELKSGLEDLRSIALKDRNLIDYYIKTSNNNELEEYIDLHFNMCQEKKLVKEKNNE